MAHHNEEEIIKILRTDDERHHANNAPFNAATGQGAGGQRFTLSLPDCPLPLQYLPQQMQHIPLIQQLQQAGTIQALLQQRYPDGNNDQHNRQAIIEQLTRLRCRYDFPFFAALYLRIKAKTGGQDVRLILNRPQRQLIATLEQQRLNNQPLRLILLKARQWGGSTAIQLYMLWLQTMHRTGLNSLIIAQQTAATDEIKQMFLRAIEHYPLHLLYHPGQHYNNNEKKIITIGHSGTITRIPQRNCTIKIGTAERPDSTRSGDYALVHFSEVAYWKKTEGKNPQDIVAAAAASVAYQPYTLIVYESTANGTGNFFHTEYNAAKEGTSMFTPLFIPWYHIERYTLPLNNQQQRQQLAETLYTQRYNDNRYNNRHATGKYLWYLWEQGATLDAINWYITERKKYDSDEKMQAEFPTDDIEAFVHSGTHVFDRYAVEEMRKTCRPPQYTGEIQGDTTTGPTALNNVHFTQDQQGQLTIWEQPDSDDTERVLHRYAVIVDIGGRSYKADWSVIAVIDRLFMVDGGPPQIVAQWYGHIDMDHLAWKAAAVATYYDNALLVIESNTLETHDRERNTDGDHSGYILNQIKDAYDNLYAREQSPEAIAEGKPRLYGFHTNTATKPLVIDTLIAAVRDKLYIERDSRALDELLTYERKQNGAYGAIIGKHDDLLMSRAIGLYITLHVMPTPVILPRQQRPPQHKKATITTL